MPTKKITIMSPKIYPQLSLERSIVNTAKTTIMNVSTEVCIKLFSLFANHFMHPVILIKHSNNDYSSHAARNIKILLPRNAVRFLPNLNSIVDI